MNDLALALEKAIVADASTSELAHAKVNLALHVTGRRHDGYHTIESIVVFADYADVISVAPSEDGRMHLAVKGPFANTLAESSTPDSNLVIRAASALMRASGGRAPATRLTLTKRLPISAGIGGGSADAAATLRLLNRQWRFALKDDKLREIGVKLGADVPMCLESRPLVAKGIGEQITPIEGMPALSIVMAKPKVAVTTKDVFARLSPADRVPLPTPPRFRSLLDVVFWLRQTRNDLAEPAEAVTKLAGSASKFLMRDPECLFARMSGSGATAFGIFATMDAAERAANRLRHEKPTWWVVAAQTKGS